MTAATPGPAALFDLTGKVALVTGGSRGLGREMVLAFASAGADVVIASRKLDNCKALAEEIEAAGRRALPVACHVGRWNECDELADRAYEHFGRAVPHRHIEALAGRGQAFLAERGRARRGTRGGGDHGALPGVGRLELHDRVTDPDRRRPVLTASTAEIRDSWPSAAVRLVSRGGPPSAGAEIPRKQFADASQSPVSFRD